MIELPSFTRGFARNAAESQAPEQWKGLDHLWVPALGPTAGQLRDIGPKRRHLTITASTPPDWGLHRYGTAYLAQRAGRAVAGDNASANYTTLNFALEVWWTQTESNWFYAVSKGSNNVAGYYWVPQANGSATFVSNQSGVSQQATFAAGSFLFNTPQHVVLTFEGVKCVMFVNGVRAAKTTDNDIIAPASAGLPFTLGGAGGSSLQGYVYKAATYSRRITAGEAAQMASDPLAVVRLA